MENRKIISDDSFEMELKISLKSFGFLFPTTDDEVEEFEKKFGKTFEKLPESLQNPMEILKQGRIKSIPLKSVDIIDIKTTENLKMAARKGEKIPKEILDKMKNDRKNRENEKE